MIKILKSAKKAYKRLTWQRGLYIAVLATMVLSLGQFSVPQVANAATSVGPLNAGTGTNVDRSSGPAWSNPNNITTVGSPYATVSLGNSASDYLQATNYGFSIPGTAIINGIEVTINRRSNSNNNNHSIDDDVVKLIKDGAIIGDNKATSSDWPTSFATANYGGVADLWGTTWTPAQINSSNFGVALSIESESNQNRTGTVDYIKVTVTYTLPVQPVTNPTLGATCGLDIALVADTSGSINSTEMTQMKNALSAFATAFSGTPTEFSLTRFSSSATVLNNFSLTPAQAATAIGGLPSSGSGYTNWEDGLAKAWSTFDPRPNPNLIIFASDGEPTESDGPLSHLEDAITVANTIKSAGTRIITLGIGIDAGGQANMEKISSADAYYGAASFDALAATLAQLASDLCGGTITVTKLIDNTPTAGWTFDVAGESLVTGQNGQTSAKEVDPGTYSVTETVENGYEVASAVCYNQSQEVEGTWNGNAITGINVSANDIITCTFNNRLAPYCGDGIKNGNEDCDGKSGVIDGYRCTQSCTLERIPDACQVGPISLLNGDFETPEVTHNDKWDIFASGASGVGWTVEWEGVYDGAPQTANLELHRGVNSWSPYSGSQYTELDSDWDGPDGSVNGEQASVKIYQDVTTIPGAAYQLSYAYSPRPGKGTADNYLGVRLDNTLVKEHQTDGTALSDTSWQTDSVNFVATSTSVRIEFVDLGTPDSFGTFLDDVTLELIECPYPKATVIAHKIVCNSETDLPNWSNDITVNASTAQDFVNNSQGACRFEEGWQFQWGDHQIEPKLPGNMTGPTLASGWYMFDSATGPAGQPAQVTINLTGLPGKLWFREVLQTGYIPFSYPSTEYPTAPGSDVSAEFWCDTDVLNYDNSEFINVSEDNTYYCVAMNVPEPKPVDPTGTIEVCKYEDTDGNGEPDYQLVQNSFVDKVKNIFINVVHALTPPNPLSGWTINITDGNQYNDSKVTGVDGCVEFTNLPYTTYTITETQQSGWVQTFPDNNSIVIDLDANYNWTYFLNHRAPTGDIHGYKWNDVDGDGQHGGEELMSGWRIFIDANDNGQLDEGETYMDTSNDQNHYGWYWFENLPYGEYRICEVLQTNWYQTYPADPNCHTVTLTDTNPQLFDVTPNYIEYPAPEYNFGNQYREPNPPCTVNCGGGGGPVPTYNPAISIAKTGDASVVPGGVGNFSLTVTNTGNAVATNVVVTDTLPAGFTFTDNGLATNSWNLGNMNAGQVEVINYSVNVPADADGQYTNISTVSIDGSAVVPYYAEDDHQFTAVQVLGFEVEAEEPAEVQVLGYESLPETGGPVAANNYTWFGALLLMAGTYLVRRYNI